MLEHLHATPTAPVRAVVLGSRGFIGAALTKRLGAEGIDYLPVSSAEIDLAAAGATDRLASLLRPDDALVMLSALTPDKGRDIGTTLRNLEMGRTVVEAIGRSPVAHVVYISSDAVYPFGEGRVSEESPAAPIDLYGTMHRAREIMLRQATTAPVAVLRPTLVYGATDTHNSYGPSRFRRQAAKDGIIPLGGEGEETRDHILVDDAVELILRVLTRRSAGLLNLVSGRSISFSDLARLVAVQFDAPVEIRHIPRTQPATFRAFDTTACAKAFPDFSATPLEVGIARTHCEAMGPLELRECRPPIRTHSMPFRRGSGPDDDPGLKVSATAARLEIIRYEE